MKLNFFQKLLKKIGLLKVVTKTEVKTVTKEIPVEKVVTKEIKVPVEKIVYKEKIVEKQEEFPPLVFTTKSNGLFYEILNVDFKGKHITLSFSGGKKNKEIGVTESDFEYEKLDKNKYKIFFKEK